LKRVNSDFGKTDRAGPSQCTGRLSLLLLLLLLSHLERMPAPASVRALVRAIPTIVRLQNRALISVSGSQAAEFLNGLLSSAVTNQPYRSFYSSFLHAQVSLVRMLAPPLTKAVVKSGPGHIRRVCACDVR
jgi:hypothetical protein